MVLRTFTAEELKEQIESHQRWLVTGGDERKRADLSYADLSSANLSYADLSYADLK